MQMIILTNDYYFSKFAWVNKETDFLNNDLEKI